ncbi:Upstream-binding protein 1 [Pseudolycoriella hygida]|uniref:Upstream-binding protein 1 n=1 Tax=Pseudolycoriella hygida TaxID=35572 RepID=A0A9Q0N1Z6_9DIPT|nr:Upstream-binding protein 1 [Pseudolycoriella hygida]
MRMTQCFDFSIEEQMDFRSANIADENITRTIYGNNTSELQLLVDQTIDFVDTQSNTKETWTSDFNKAVMLGPQVTSVENIQTVPRKRQMDWESLEISTANSPPTGPKITSVASIKDRRKIARIGWTDDIDFDLNGDLTSNAYLNNEAFLSLSSALNILKHEIPSPSSEQLKQPKSPQERSGLAVNHQQTQVGTVVNGPVKEATLCNEHPPSVQKPKNQPDVLDSSSNSNLACNHDSSSCGKTQNPVDGQFKFQYVLAAPTSIATKNNEDTLTYLNQGQSYEIKLKKLGDLSTYRGKILKSIIKICFHERRLQYMEREQIHQWQASRPGERIVEIDVPLSYGLCHVSQPNNQMLNTVEVLWDPMKEVGVYIQVNCISTEFTPKKHGGEKGVPFRIQIETYLDKNGDGRYIPIHAAACQIKVFKLKGADRKHKQDREKIQKRTRAEQEKYQPSFECTILSDIPNDSITPPICYSPEHGTSSSVTKNRTTSPVMPRSPVQAAKYDNSAFTSNSPHPIGINSVSSSNSNLKSVDTNSLSPRRQENEDAVPNITIDSSPVVLTQWMTHHRLNQHASTFAHYSGADLLRMSKEDIIQICGVADGIRMYNTLHSKAIKPRLKFYVSFDGNSYHAIYLHEISVFELTQKLCKLPGFYDYSTNNANGDSNNFHEWSLQSKYSGSGSNIYDASKTVVYIDGPSGIHVLVSDEVLNNIKDECLFSIECQNGRILMKTVYKNEIN